MRLRLRFVLIASVLPFLVSCDRFKQRTSSERKDVTAASLTFALSPMTPSGQTTFSVAGPDLASAAFCTSDGAGQCTSAKSPMFFGRDAVGRRIYSSPAPLTLQDNIILTVFTASSTGQQVTASIQLKPRTGGAVPGGGATLPTGAVRWKAVLMASDQGDESQWINAFDNARKSVYQILVNRGVQAADIRQLSMHPDQQSNQIAATSEQGLQAALNSFNPMGATDACLVHMTSHGSPDGFNIGYDRLAPSSLNSYLDASCGQRPTVVLISACFSGLYTLDESNVKKPNRVILTAARSDLTSFGCGTENQYTYWDSCLIESLPSARTWTDLAQSITSCITQKEAGGEQSFPQTFIGSQMQTFPLPGSN